MRQLRAGLWILLLTASAACSGSVDGSGAGECFDPDGDGYGTGAGCRGKDCDAADVLHWSDCGDCVDYDGDGRGRACDTGNDCNESDRYHWADCDRCLDYDDDERGVDCDLGRDCDETDVDNWESCATCVDEDGDGYLAGCDDYTALTGPDCDDLSPLHWSDCSACADADRDDFGNGCDWGDDCNDGNDDVNPTAADPTQDGVDQNCDGMDGPAVSDDFEGGTTMGADWLNFGGGAAITASAGVDASYGLRLGGGGDTATTASFDTTACERIVWSYRGKRGPEAPEGGDALQLQYWNSAGWVTVDTWYGTGAVDAEFQLRWGMITAGDALHPTMAMRFVNTSGAIGTDDFFVDQVSITCSPPDSDADGVPPVLDCNSMSGKHWFDCGVCVDADADDRGEGCDVDDDCDDADTNVWDACGSCVDADADLHFVGCDRYFSIKGPDCNESSPLHWYDCGVCDDLDRDDYGQGCDAGRDCDPDSGAHWADCGRCADADSDDRGPGCDTGADCAPVDGQHWADCGACQDTDVDGYGVGCDLGADCDIDNPSRHPGAGDLTIDGVDQNCNGFDGTSLHDDFDAVEIDGSVWDLVVGDAALSNVAVASGTQSLMLGGGVGVARTLAFDTTGCTRLVWFYRGKRGPEAPDGGDTLRLQYYDGLNWTDVNSWSGNGAVDSGFSPRWGTLTSAAAFRPNFQMRFITNGSGEGSDQFYVEDFTVGCAPVFDQDGDGIPPAIDCLEGDAMHWFDCGLCSDLDGDDYGPQCDPGADCSVGDPDVWATCGSCRDSDGDGFWVSCNAYAIKQGPDCTDGDAAHWADCGSCSDGDGDDYGPSCDLGADCAAADPAHWTDCGTCNDADGDDYGPGCDLGTDCEAASSAHWNDCATCVDLDNDDYGEGCNAGDDCDDDDNARSPGRVDISLDFVDQDCNDVDGLFDQFNTASASALWNAVTGDASPSSTTAYSAPYALNLGGGGGTATTRVFDTSACGLIAWRYFGKRGAQAPGTTDTLVVEYFNGASWVVADTWSGSGLIDNAFSERQGVINAAAARHAAFQLRLRSTGGGTGTDDFFVDDFAFGCSPDGDGDGSPVVFDCDDGDNTRYPGAADTVDGTDQSCDGFDGPRLADDFEAGAPGTYPTSVWASLSGDGAYQTTYSSSGSYALNLAGGGGVATTNAIDTSSCTNVGFVLRVKRGPSAPSAGENLTLEYWDGGAWQLAQTVLGTGFSDAAFLVVRGELTAAAAMHAAFQLRLVSNGSITAGDDFYIDDFALGCTLDFDADTYSALVDCDDGDSTVHPGATDASADGVDQDCNGFDGPVIVDEDFEAGSSNWTLTGSWGVTASSAHAGSYSLTDTPGGNYTNGLNTSATFTQPFTLVGATSANLTFWHRYSTESCCDYGQVEISVDGASWTSLAAYSGSQTTWTQVTLPLTAYLGQPSVRLRFRFTTDGSVTSDGWYIDDVLVSP